MEESWLARGPAMDAFPTSKRAACDRCRGQKLRCPARADPSLPCDRCVRAGKTCVTGYAKPLGRAQRILANASSMTSQETQAPGSYSHSSGSGISTSGSPNDRWSWKNVTVPNGDASSTSFAGVKRLPHGMDPSLWLLDSVDLDFLTTQDMTDFVGNENFSELWSPNSGPTFDHHISTQAGPHHDNTAQLLENAPHGEFTPLQPARMVENVSSPNGSSLAYEDSGLSKDALSATDCDRRLSELSIDLSRHVGRIKLHDYDHNFDNSGAFPENCDHEVLDSIARTLKSNSMFISLIQSYARGTCSAADRMEDVTSTNGNILGSPHDFLCSLNILSTYIRLISLSDNLFKQIFASIKDDSERHTRVEPNGAHAQSTIPQILPGLQLAGFTVTQSSFQAQILVQAVLHQFETMAQQLGLPAELRVSDTLSLESARHPVGAPNFKLVDMLQKSQCGFVVAVGGEQNGKKGDSSSERSEVVASLRRSIAEVQALLGTLERNSGRILNEQISLSK
jgi:hypothetical protein